MVWWLQIYLQFLMGDDKMDVARELESYTIDDIYALPDGNGLWLW